MNNATQRSIIDRIRLWWAGFRFDCWLDVYSVPRQQRRDLRTELTANLLDASHDVGLSTALAQLGSLRTLAADTASDGVVRPRWQAGLVAAFSVLAVSVVSFMGLTLYYVEGVLDAGATQPVTSSLFPYFWSSISVNPATGLEVGIQPGPLPLALAAVTWFVVAAPWRSLIHKSTPAKQPT